MTATTTKVAVFDFEGSGVYALFCTATGKVYVGSSETCRRRVKGHFALLAQGKHRNRHLQFAYDKYGEDSFECRILEAHEADGLLECERYWISMYDARNDQFGYNFVDPVESVGRVRRYVVYPPDGEPVEIENLHKFCRENGLCSVNMTRVAQHKASHHKHWLCRYADVTESQWLEARDRVFTLKAKTQKTFTGDYVAIAPDGSRYRVWDLPWFCSRHSLPYTGAISAASNGWRCKSWRIERLTREGQARGASL